MASLTFRGVIGRAAKRPLFWLCVAIMCAVPTGDDWHSTGTWYFCGVPFSAVSVKHGNMGTGGTLREGVLYIPDFSAKPVSGVGTGWFFHPEWLGVVLNTLVCFLLVYAAASVLPWLARRRSGSEGP
jgi:hypothetical protein